MRAGRDDSLARELSALGAFSVSHEDSIRGVHPACWRPPSGASRTRARIWRISRAGRDTQRFGGAFIRGYRRIRRLAAGVTAELYVAESERAGALVALKVARDRQDEDQPVTPSGGSCRSTRSRSASPARVVRLYDLGVSDEHA